MTQKRILYAAGDYGQAEIDAVLRVMSMNPGSLAIGEHVGRMEARVATLFGKGHGVMCNSGSSALFLAIELLDLPEGSEIISPALTFSTDLSAIVRAGHVPVFVDVEQDTFNIDAAKIPEMITSRTRALLVPNLAGGCPDWDAIRRIADEHDLKIIEDSCDALGATLHGLPTGKRSDISVTSFALSHIITCAGNGGMVLLDDEELKDRALLLRRWGRRSELLNFGSKRPESPGRGRSFFEDLDGISYDNMFIFDELAWNFEPSEIGAAFGLVQLDKLKANYERRIRTFGMYTEAFGRHPEAFTPPRQLDGVHTAWLSYPFLVNRGAGFDHPDLQAYLEERGIDTRTVWTGNAARQPFLRDVDFREPEGGLPNSDFVMTNGMLLTCSHAIADDGIEYVIEQIDSFMEGLSDE